MNLVVRASAFHLSLAFWMMLLSCLLNSVESLKGNETDRLALFAFKAAIGQDPFGVLSSWNDSLHYCQWKGVTCSRRHPQRVTALKIINQSLSGFISPSIGNLTFLRTLYLTNNTFHGNIPKEIGRLFRLRSLSLRRSSLQGGIPTNLSSCSRLQVIDLLHNKLTGRIPDELSSLSQLEILYLDHNQLTGSIPPSLGNLSSLLELFLNSNRLEGHLPEDINGLNKMYAFNLAENKLSGSIPSTLFNLSSIKQISISVNRLYGSIPPISSNLPLQLQALLLGDNQLTGPIPISLANASQLVDISFELNHLSGSLPSNLGTLQALQVLGLGFNRFRNNEGDDLSILTSLTNCSRLKELRLTSNLLTGALSSSIANLSTQLEKLDMGNNLIVGSIPAEIENLFNLISLGLFQNSLTGPIPTSIGKLHNLQGLYLYENNFSGHIPSSLANITGLTVLDLHTNALKGNIPPSLGKLQGLQELYLHENNFIGSIPKQIVDIPSLFAFSLNDNHLIGTLPVEIGNLKLLGHFSVSRNNLSGEIPSTLGNCLSMLELYMDGNFFHGGIPPSFRNLRGIENLDLSQNNLSGAIPNYLTTLQSLQFLNLSFNDFDGEVPKVGIFSNASNFSVKGNTKLCGGIQSIHLPPCLYQVVNKHPRKRILIIVIPIACVFLSAISCLCIGVALHSKRKSRKKPCSTSNMDTQGSNISYADLYKATDGFSMANLLGEGSFGSVFKGILEHEEKVVAVKVLNLGQRGASKSFIAECLALRNIRQRNLVKIITVCSSIDFQGNDFKALVFEYMPNKSLETWLHPNEDEQNLSENLSLTQRLNVAIDVALALEYLHHHCDPPVVHRDIKPSNVLLDNDMVAHVGDFGLAKILFQDSQYKSSSVAIKGSIGYVAPEYGIGREASTDADVYSFGILLLEMITGKRPTNVMFQDSISLREFVKVSLPKGLMEMVDPKLLSEEATNINGNMSNKMLECLVSVVKVGLSCSVKSAVDRIQMYKTDADNKGLIFGVGILQYTTRGSNFGSRFTLSQCFFQLLHRER